ncbi:hypothetical protein J2W83_002950 [Pseudomonas hunanensis]|uniref:Uncharacterized protein n=1 Tax=Pseudomonas hunanensis TaxID=1247546 RepID=A0ACC6K4K9_9PSED|nr:hypothetical protein [Pseudomonas hunanensis]
MDSLKPLPISIWQHAEWAHLPAQGAFQTTATNQRGGFADGINAAQYQAVAKVSKATATRHLSDLLEKGCLMRLPGGGRSTRYQINWPDSTTATDGAD